jgi:hypothetical protein
MIKRYFKRLKAEFKGYNAGKFGKDVLAGITVAAGHSVYRAVRLPPQDLSRHLSQAL